MTSKAEQEEHEKRSEAAKKAAETRAKNKEAEENGENGEESTEPEPVQAATLTEAGEPQANPNTVDDGVEDIALGEPQVGQWVQITGGEYAGRLAHYLGDLPTLPDDSEVRTIQVRTRDADNLLLDVPYSDVSSTTYSGGR